MSFARFNTTRIEASVQTPRFATMAGFSLVELVMVIVIAGVLAATIMPRFFDTNVFQSRGFADQVKSSLRYAQKIAIAQRRNVCVTIIATGISLRIAGTSGAAAACDTDLASPAGQPPNCPSPTYKICAPSAAITLTLSVFIFDALGRPSAAQSITVGGVALPIIVEAETGYVH